MNEDRESVGNEPDQAKDAAVTAADKPAGVDMNDPTDTDHPTGKKQAAENAANESPA